MKTLLSAVLICVMGLGFAIDNAEAGRLGGGKSFGGKQSFSQPYNRSVQKEQPSAPAAAPQQGAAGAAGGAAAGAAGGAAKAGMMGALGGLMVGGLLGALFFGGAFENINFMDILVFGLIAFLAYKLLASRRRGQAQQPVAAGYGRVETPVEQYHQPQQRQAHQQPVSAPQQKQSSGFDTDLMFKGDKPELGSAAVAPRFINKPAGFDEQHFLSGAKSLFVMLQKAWDNGDLADIREFTTDAVFAEIQDQYRAREGDSHTEVLNAHAELFDVREVDNALEAAALFTVSLNEDGEEVHIQEIWHFTKPKAAIMPTWFLDGIQQIEQ